MSFEKILLLGKDKKRAHLLISLFKEKQFDASVVEKISEADNLISSSELTLILIDYRAIIDAKRQELITLFKNAQKSKFVIFDVPEDATRRLAFYRLGAYRILDENYNVEDIYYFCENLLTNNKAAQDHKDARFSGRLQDFNLPGLINSFGKEKRSGVLRITTPKSSGKIFFNLGHIYHASAGYLKDDEAVLYMLTWTQGLFYMSPLPRKEVTNRLRLSNVGLLLYSEKIRDEFNTLVKKLGSVSREMKLVNQGDLLIRVKDSKFINFLEKLSDFRQLYDIIENSPYPMIETLQQLNALNESNNLKFRESSEAFEDLSIEKKQESSGLSERLLSFSEVDQLRKNLNATEIASGKLLILSGDTISKTEFIRQFNQGSVSSVRSNQELDFTVIELAEDFSLQVFGITMAERLSEIIEQLAEGLVGFVFLINANQESKLEYTNYVINNLLTVHQVPWTIAVTNLKKSVRKIPAKIKSTINIDGRRNILICDVKNKDDVRTVILSLKL